jgi:isopenicillin N synthase-like dioxygenase
VYFSRNCVKGGAGDDIITKVENFFYIWTLHQISLDMTIPILDLSLADNPRTRPLVLKQLFDAAFNVGFLYIKNHGVNSSIVSELANKLPNLFHLSIAKKLSLSKLNSPHFLGYNGYAQETTLGKRDLREQFDYATELPIIWKETNSNNKESKAGNDNYSQLYWRLRGPNQWPAEDDLKGFREALTRYILRHPVLDVNADD